MSKSQKYLLIAVIVAALLGIFAGIGFACYKPIEVVEDLPDYCPNEEGYQPYGPCYEEPEVTPEPTKAPEQLQGNPPVFAGSSTETPSVCSVSDIGKVSHINVLQGTPNDHKVTVQWPLVLGADSVHIWYREYSESTWTHALLNTPNDGNEEIGELKNGINYAFAVSGVKGCGVGALSPEFDPKP